MSGNHLAPKTSTDQLTMRPAAQHRMKATLADDRPTPPPTHRARVANAPTPRPARDGPPWHHGILPNETCMLPVRLATPAAREDVPARVSGTGRPESPLGSCPTSLEHLSISSSTSTCLLECGRLCSPCCSMDSGILHLRADAGDTEPRRRAINEQLALSHHLTRDSAQSGPTTSRTRRFGGHSVLQVSK